MFELIASSLIIGQSLIGPNLIQTDYLTSDNQVITIQETITETPDTQPCNLWVSFWLESLLVLYFQQLDSKG